jgi:hypothetical protein
MKKSSKKKMPKYFLISLTLTSFIIFSCEKKHENESNQSQIEESILKNERQNDEVLYDSPTDTVESLYIGEENNISNSSTPTESDEQTIWQAEESLHPKPATLLDALQHPNANPPTNQFDALMRDGTNAIHKANEKKQRSLYERMTYEEAPPPVYFDASNPNRK